MSPTPTSLSAHAAAASASSRPIPAISAPSTRPSNRSRSDGPRLRTLAPGRSRHDRGGADSQGVLGAITPSPVVPASPTSRPSTLVTGPPQIIYCEQGCGPSGQAGGEPEMLITLTWLRLDGLRRWRSLAGPGPAHRPGHRDDPDLHRGCAPRPERVRPALGPHAARDRHGAAQPARVRLGQGRSPARSRRADQVPGRVRVRGAGLPGGQHRVPAGRRPDDPDHRAARHPGRAAVQPAPRRRSHGHAEVRRDVRQARG